MNFKAVLEEGHSKKITSAIVYEVDNSPEKFAQLMLVFQRESKTIKQRAAWPISYIGQLHPHLLTPYYNLFIKLLNQPNKHNAINRGILRALQTAAVPEKFQGELLYVCFRLLNSPKEPIAVKAFSIDIIKNLAETYPEIVPELKVSIENLLPNASAGIKSKANNVLGILK